MKNLYLLCLFVAYSFEVSSHQSMTELTLTAIFEEAKEGGFIGYVAELPGANTQGETLEEVRENLTEAIDLILSSNREEFERNFSSNGKVTRETVILRAA
jgi:predicted RNase H-like HicB family nuclease